MVTCMFRLSSSQHRPFLVFKLSLFFYKCNTMGYHSETPELTCGVCVAQSLGFCVVCSGLLFISLYLFFGLMYYLFFELRLSSNFSYYYVPEYRNKKNRYVREYRKCNHNGYTRKTGNIGYTRRRKTKQKQNTLCVGHHCTQTKTNNVKKGMSPPTNNWR